MALVEAGTLTPGASLDGALTITTSQGGAVNSPGVGFSPATDECERILAAAGLPSPKGVGTAPGLRGIACNQAWMFSLAAARSPGLTRAGLATGMASSGAVDLSFPLATAEITDSANPTGGQYWRPAMYHHDCTCFAVVDPTFRHDFG